MLNYIPILEEETTGHLVELCKKQQENDSSDNSGDCDGDDNSESEFTDHSVFSCTQLFTGGQKIADKGCSYRLPYSTSITPPPKL